MNPAYFAEAPPTDRNVVPNRKEKGTVKGENLSPQKPSKNKKKNKKKNSLTKEERQEKKRQKKAEKEMKKLEKAQAGK